MVISLLFGESTTSLVNDLVDNKEPKIVPGKRLLLSRIAETNDKFDHAGK